MGRAWNQKADDVMTPEQEQMVLDNMRLVHYFAHKLAPRLADGNSYDYEDLVGEGQIALIKAVERFDPSKGFKFSTFAGPSIDGAMRKFLGEHVPTVKHSPSVVRLANKMITDGLIDLPPAEAAEILGVTEDKILRVYDYLNNRRCAELDRPVSDDEGKDVTLLDSLSLADTVDFDRQLIIDEFVGTLDERERYILKAAIAGERQQDISKRLGISQTHVSRISRKIMEKAEGYGKGGDQMPNMAEMRKLIPLEKLKELLLENKTSSEIGAMYGLERKDIENLKRSYKINKEKLGVSYFDRYETYKPEREVEDIVIDIPEAVAQEAEKGELPEWVEQLLAQGDSRIIINAQNITINIGA